MKLYLKVILFFLMLWYPVANSQGFKSNGGALLGVKMVLGNQNKMMQLGISTFGTASFGKLAFEGGFSLYKGFVLQRHTIATNGFIGGYDVFYVAGYGNNQNLLGSSLSQYNAPIIYDVDKKDSFVGVGFGFEKQYLPRDLKEFNQRLGRLMLRYAKNDVSYGLTFKNDFKLGTIFYGQATDFGDTGSLFLTYTSIKNKEEVSQIGLAIQLFTPKPEYTQIADNYTNSDDGRKNVWHTTGVYKDVFYANAYIAYKHQTHNFVYQSKLGIESNKLGAYIQNRLHDNFGLNPRYPWHVTKNNQSFVEADGQCFIKNK